MASTLIGKQAVVDRAHGYISRAGPQLVVVHAGQRITVVLVFLAVAQYRVLLARIVRGEKRTVVVLHFSGGQ